MGSCYSLRGEEAARAWNVSQRDAARKEDHVDDCAWAESVWLVLGCGYVTGCRDPLPLPRRRLFATTPADVSGEVTFAPAAGTQSWVKLQFITELLRL